MIDKILESVCKVVALTEEEKIEIVLNLTRCLKDRKDIVL